MNRIGIKQKKIVKKVFISILFLFLVIVGFHYYIAIEFGKSISEAVEGVYDAKKEWKSKGTDPIGTSISIISKAIDTTEIRNNHIFRKEDLYGVWVENKDGNVTFKIDTISIAYTGFIDEYYKFELSNDSLYIHLDNGLTSASKITKLTKDSLILNLKDKIIRLSKMY